MNFNEYQELASRTANTKLQFDQRLCNWAMGLCGEAGEYTELIKKQVFHGVRKTREEKCKELGDILWYLAQAAREEGISLEEVAVENIEKLRHRYPEGFKQGGGVRHQMNNDHENDHN